MHKGGGSWGLAKHRQGGNGRNAQPPSRWAKMRRAMEANGATREATVAREAHRAMQEWKPIEEWLAERGLGPRSRR